MATVQVPAHWVGQNYLPPICARHGGPATRLVPRRFFTPTPGWSYLLILVSLLVFAIVTLSIRKSVRTALPACAQCPRDRRQFVALAISGWVAVISIMAVAVTYASGPIFVVGFVAILVAVPFTFAGDYFRVGGTVHTDLVWVTLKRVDETFAATINNAVRPAAHFLATTRPPQSPTSQARTSSPVSSRSRERHRSQIIAV